MDDISSLNSEATLMQLIAFLKAQRAISEKQHEIETLNTEALELQNRLMLLKIEENYSEIDPLYVPEGGNIEAEKKELGDNIEIVSAKMATATKMIEDTVSGLNLTSAGLDKHIAALLDSMDEPLREPTVSIIKDNIEKEDRDILAMINAHAAYQHKYALPGSNDIFSSVLGMLDKLISDIGKLLASVDKLISKLEEKNPEPAPEVQKPLHTEELQTTTLTEEDIRIALKGSALFSDENTDEKKEVVAVEQEAEKKTTDAPASSLYEALGIGLEDLERANKVAV